MNKQLLRHLLRLALRLKYAVWDLTQCLWVLFSRLFETITLSQTIENTVPSDTASYPR